LLLWLNQERLDGHGVCMKKKEIHAKCCLKTLKGRDQLWQTCLQKQRWFSVTHFVTNVIILLVLIQI